MRQRSATTRITNTTCHGYFNAIRNNWQVCERCTPLEQPLKSNFLMAVSVGWETPLSADTVFYVSPINLYYSNLRWDRGGLRFLEHLWRGVARNVQYNKVNPLP